MLFKDSVHLTSSKQSICRNKPPWHIFNSRRLKACNEKCLHCKLALQNCTVLENDPPPTHSAIPSCPDMQHFNARYAGFFFFCIACINIYEVSASCLPVARRLIVFAVPAGRQLLIAIGCACIAHFGVAIFEYCFYFIFVLYLWVFKRIFAACLPTVCNPENFAGSALATRAL